MAVREHVVQGGEIARELQLDESSTEALLRGSTFDGQGFEGIDTVNIVP